jgi:hypothetical protein
MIDSSKLKDAVLKEVKSMLAKEIAEWKQAVEQHQQKQKEIARKNEPKRIGFKF